MSMSNIEYSALKKKGGLHNWGYSSNKTKNEFDFNVEALEEMDVDIQTLYEPELLHQNTFGEYYALQDFEE
jgi:hypothetical protein